MVIKVLSLLFLIVTNTYAECVYIDSSHDTVEALVNSSVIDCENRTDAKILLRALANQQKIQLESGRVPSNRHEVGAKFNHCQASVNHKALVINFEGTGSYSPRTNDLMLRFSRCAGDGDLGKSLHYEAQKAIEEVYGQAENWSALQAGPLNKLASMNATEQLAWVSFASEESEVLANPKKLSNYAGMNSAIYPRGIESAVACFSEYILSAKAMNVAPKIIVQGHSSGGRSAVKFIDYVKTLSPPVEIDLFFSIDPVKEAHLAVGEVVSQIAGNANRSLYNLIPFVEDKEIKPPNVWTRHQPEILYRPRNTKRMINVYQNVDTDGLKGPIKFGIHGSPIEGADVNRYISDELGSDAHGLIGRHEKTLELLVDEYRTLQIIP